MPLAVGVWESVPTKVSKYSEGAPLLEVPFHATRQNRSILS